VSVDEHVARREIHAVAVVAGERDRPLVEDADEAGVAALVRAVGPAVGVGGGHEDHVAALDERPVVLVDRSPRDELLVDAVREPARVETILEAARSVVVGRHSSMIAPGVEAVQLASGA
jgi:hypothetical protein